MCETNAYIVKDGREELYLESIDLVRPDGGRVLLKNLFGEQKTLEGTIKEISFSEHRVVLEEKG